MPILAVADQGAKRRTAMPLFFNAREFLRAPLPAVPGLQIEEATLLAARHAHASCVIPEGMPFVLDESGQFDYVFNDFLISLPTTGAKSRRTWRSYAYDLLSFQTFLIEECSCNTLLKATAFEVAKYYSRRRLGDTFAQSKPEIVEKSWKRARLSLERFYDWAVQRGHIQSSPMRTEAKIMMKQRGTKASGAGGHRPIKCISIDQYIQFRDLGLRGLLKSGEYADKRMIRRNVAFSELLVTTGLRASEATALLLAEIPRQQARVTSDETNSVKFTVASHTAKGEFSRNIYIPKRVIVDFIEPYLTFERSHAVAKNLSRGGYQSVRARYVRCKELSSTSGKIDIEGQWVSRKFSAMDIHARGRLLEVDAKSNILGPASLWLNEAGEPLELSSVNSIFRRACEHLFKEHGIALEVSPHTLRHTFAVYTLSMLIKGMLSRIVEERLSNELRISNPYSTVVMDPLRIVQHLLGHASQETTQIVHGGEKTIQWSACVCAGAGGVKVGHWIG